MQTTAFPGIAGLIHSPEHAQAQPASERQAIVGRADDVQRIASAGMAALGSLLADASITDARPQSEQVHTGDLLAMLAELEASAARLAEACRVSRDTG
ncbi:hypothetical protein S4A8_02315 [Salinisphaera sp. S4-8]|uniref:hypothetical protein n=1 Tax=Salinisphaera sp. S4-8 TaxID=633357 RepID=UPI0033419130